MSTVVIIEDALDTEEWREYYDIEDVALWLAESMSEWPSSARIYLDQVSVATDVTPATPEDVERLRTMTGTFYVVIYPEGPLVFAIIAIVIAIVAIAVTFLFRPSANAKDTAQQSPNNALSGRSNSARPNERIPDIVGTVNSVPDLIAPPYSEYVNSQEVEVALMCVGKGSYTITPDKVWDDTTLIRDIAGSSVEIYAPFTSPNSSAAPQLRIGAEINRKMITADRMAGVNGQVLRSGNYTNYTGNNNITFGRDYILGGETNLDFTAHFVAGTDITVSNSGATGLDLTGTYGVLSVTRSEIVLANPGAIKPDWDTLGFGVQTPACSATLANSGDAYTSLFILPTDDMTEVWCNFVAPQGLYVTNNGVQSALDIQVQMSVQAIDAAGNLIGFPVLYRQWVYGSSTMQSTRAATLKAVLPHAGRCAVKALCSIGDVGDQVVSEIQWKDCYAISPITANDFGNVTIIQSLTYATEGATSIKSRKLNMIATRNIQRCHDLAGGASTLTEDGTVITKGYTPGTDNVGPSDDAAEIMFHLSLDPYVGRRNASEIEFDNVIGQMQKSAAYFGTPKVTQFGYTFDDSNVSFEETLSDVAQAVFSTPYRRGSSIGLRLETQTDNSVMLFNHRNKKPNDETRTFAFGLPTENDGIQIDYIDPNAPNFPDQDSTVSLYFPEDQSATNAKKIKAIGVRNNVQAKLLGWRYYQKLKHQYLTTQFTALPEAQLLLKNERFLCADNTRQETIDGEIADVYGLEVTLTQPATLVTANSGHMIYLQHPNRTVEIIAITPGSDFGAGFDSISGHRKVVLAHAPAVPIHTDFNDEIRTPFVIVGPVDQTATAFLLTDRTPEDDNLHTMKAVNYDARYYSHDKDVINGILDDNDTVYVGVGYGDGLPPLGPGGVPGVPQGLRASSSPPDVTVEIDWGAVSGDDTTYELQRTGGQNGGNTIDNNGWQTVTITSGLSQNDNVFQPDVAWYRVRAINPNGVSDWAGPVYYI